MAGEPRLSTRTSRTVTAVWTGQHGPASAHLRVGRPNVGGDVPTQRSRPQSSSSAGMSGRSTVCPASACELSPQPCCSATRARSAGTPLSSGSPRTRSERPLRRGRARSARAIAGCRGYRCGLASRGASLLALCEVHHMYFGPDSAMVNTRECNQTHGGWPCLRRSSGTFASPGSAPACGWSRPSGTP